MFSGMGRARCRCRGEKGHLKSHRQLNLHIWTMAGWWGTVWKCFHCTEPELGWETTTGHMFLVRGRCLGHKWPQRCCPKCGRGECLGSFRETFSLMQTVKVIRFRSAPACSDGQCPSQTAWRIYEYSGSSFRLCDCRAIPTRCVIMYHQWEKRVVKWLLHFPQEIDLCEVCTLHLFTEAEAHVPDMEQHLYSCNNHRNCEKLHS